MDKTTELTTNMKIAVLHETPDGSLLTNGGCKSERGLFVDQEPNVDNRNNAYKMRMQQRKRISLIKHVTRITIIMHDLSYNQI